MNPYDDKQIVLKSKVLKPPTFMIYKKSSSNQLIHSLGSSSSSNSIGSSEANDISFIMNYIQNQHDNILDIEPFYIGTHIHIYIYIYIYILSYSIKIENN